MLKLQFLKCWLPEYFRICGANWYYDFSTDSFFQRPSCPFCMLVEEVRVVVFWAGCDRINDQVNFSFLAAVDLAWFWMLGLHAIYAWQLSKDRMLFQDLSWWMFFSVKSAFPVYRSRLSLRILQFLIALDRTNISQNSRDRLSAKDAAFSKKFWRDLQTCRNVRCVHCTITDWLCCAKSVTLALTINIRSYVDVLHEHKSIMFRKGWFLAWAEKQLYSACATSLAHPECVRASRRMQTEYTALTL